MLSDLIQLFNPVLQNAYDCLRASQDFEPFGGRIGLCRLDCEKDEIDWLSDLCRSCLDWSRHGDKSITILKR